MHDIRVEEELPFAFLKKVLFFSLLLESLILHGEDRGTNQLPAGHRPNNLFRGWQLINVKVCWPREHLSIDIHKVVADLGPQAKSQGVVLPL